MAPLVTGGQIINSRETRSSIGSTAVAAPAVKKVGYKRLRLIIGLATIVLGTFTLVKTFIL
jgi:hypothetical protein